MKLDFLGAGRTVTGSKYLLTHQGRKILVDCGLFQGLKELRLKNWAPFPVPASEIDAIVLTHAHLDHSGYIPVLIREGFRGSIYCTHATKELARILLLDSGYLQEEEAKYANRRGFSKHNPALPLYTFNDAERSLGQFQAVKWGQGFNPAGEFRVRFTHAGHLLGAASARVEAGGVSVLFSGDLGREDDPLMKAPARPPAADYLVIESTYGNRLHERDDMGARLEGILKRTIERGGSVLIPAFAAGRAQLLLYHLKRLRDQGRLPNVPVYLNSPMAGSVNALYQQFAEDHRLVQEEIDEVCGLARATATADDSKALNEDSSPKIVIAASGMATGGRVLHHLKKMGPDPRSTLLFVGFQAAGTRGEAIVNGAEEIKIHGQFWPIRADVINLDSMSAHADAAELIRWASAMHPRPKGIFVTHGEVRAAEAFAERISSELGVQATVPDLGTSVVLD